MQFIGLRGLHSAVFVAQLGVIMVISAVFSNEHSHLLEQEFAYILLLTI